MQKLRRWAAAALCGAAFAGSAAAALAACAVAPGRAWIVRGALFSRTLRRLRPWPGQWMPPGPPTSPEAGPPPHARAHGDALPGPDSCGNAHAGAVPRFHAAAQCRAGAGRRGPHPQRDAQAGQRRRLCGTGRRRRAKSTEHTDADLRAAVTTQNLPFAVEKNSALPQVLIMHTHATEETTRPGRTHVFDPGYTARSKSTALNMCAVGEKMAQVLNAAGIRTLHDETLYDAPGYTDSYKRSRAGVQTYLERYPSIKVVLDVADAIEDSDGTRVKPVCEIDGESTAQVMVIAGCGNGSSIALPNWRLNLRFAAEWETAMESAYPGLTRPCCAGIGFTIRI